MTKRILLLLLGLLVTVVASGNRVVHRAPPGGGGDYDSTVIADGAVAFWKLDETSGTTAADSVGSLDGTYSGGFTLSQTAPAGMAGTAVLFDGTDGTVEIPSDSALNITGDITIELWVKASTLTGSYRQIVNKSSNTPNTNRQYLVDITSGDVWRGGVYIGTDEFSVTSTTGASTSVWHHVVLTRSGSTIKLYVNGTEEDSDTASGSINTTAGDLGLAQFGSLGLGYFPGTLSRIAIYNAALSGAQITDHYTKGSTP